MQRLLSVTVLSSLFLAAACGVIRADEPSPAVEKQRQAVVAKGLDYLRKSGQADDGTFSSRAGPGLTALAVTAAMRNGLTPEDPMVKKGLAALETFVKPDGGIYGSGRLNNYETCIAMICFSLANKSGKYNKILKDAKAFVTGAQYAGKEGSPWYGGAGYSGKGRPDLSNTAHLIEALRAVDTPPDDPAIQRALAFVSRCQNHDSKFNDTDFAALVKDGGFYYEIPTEKVDPSTSKERFTPNGGLRSYGSMSYAGLKSMIYAGLTAEDPRVKAVNEWVKMHYSVTENPGMGSAGLYYYYHTFAASLSLAGVQEVKAEDGKSYDWRADLVAQLGKEQNKDGSWTNDNRRWFENDKNLATSFALMALSYCKPAEKDSEGK